MNVWINVDRCDLCKKCITLCPYNAIIFKINKLHITNRCTECKLCINMCRKQAIITNSKSKKIPNFDQHKGIFIFIEHSSQGIIKNVSLEILGKAKELAVLLKQKTTALALGYGISSSSLLLGELGADEIFIIDDKKLKNYDAQSYSATIIDIIKKEKPNIFLFGATILGRDLAPRIAKLIGSGLTADCTNLTIDPKEKILIQTRPAFGGNIIATIINKFSRPQMATVRPGVMTPCKKCQTKKPVKIKFLPCRVRDVNTKILKSIKKYKMHAHLYSAKIVIGGGRGMGTADGFKTLYNIASLLNAEVAGTRVAVEKGWISEKKQIGQTGQTIRPELYIACGISGAIQHRAGIMNSKFIIAINKDPNATIFKIANWGIIGDIHEVLQALVNYIVSKHKKTITCHQ